MSRPLLVIFLTIFVNLVGFGIIIPLLPFYAQTFGASPLVIGLLFASFSVSQLVAAPILGDLSDRLGRRPILLFSLIGTVVSLKPFFGCLLLVVMARRHWKCLVWSCGAALSALALGMIVAGIFLRKRKITRAS